ncbi:hypothetical protein BGZ70_009454 [Mortierella alpina]|uniref:Uncharacterized protein n=1 Tax=Mortierella alpina TaxID=64518 RepID=A0A9P6JCU7_MORAP|nr:hypothetical protein BGZ70_009454 [Mortierella alpina]
MRVPSIILLSSLALSLLLLKTEALPAPNPVNSSNSSGGSELDEGKKDKPVTFPVGNGIVYTKATFFVNKEKDGTKRPTAVDRIKSLVSINIGDSNKNKNKKKAGTGGDPWDAPWSELTLYGDDGYVERPVPEGCKKLPFKDQMIWDQQGHRGQIEDTDKGSALAAIAEPADEVEDAQKPGLSEGSEKDQSVGKDAGSSSTDGIRICILGLCIGDNDDNDDDDDKTVDHKLKKFLKTFRGKTLKIDADGCPVASASK